MRGVPPALADCAHDRQLSTPGASFIVSLFLLQAPCWVWASSWRISCLRRCRGARFGSVVGPFAWGKAGVVSAMDAPPPENGLGDEVRIRSHSWMEAAAGAGCCNGHYPLSDVPSVVIFNFLATCKLHYIELEDFHNKKQFYR